MIARRSISWWAWIALLLATAANWALADADADAAADAGSVGRIIIIIAAAKARLVIRHFMEVADGPRVLGLTMDIWVVLVAASLIFQTR